MPVTKSYNPDDWQVVFNNILIAGYAKGTFLKVTRNAESAAMEAGGHGDVVIVGKTDRTGKVEFTLQRESPVNALLSAQLAAFEARPRVRGAGRGPFLAKNLNSPATLATAANAVIEKVPDMEGADNNSPIVWTLLLDDATMFNAGAVA